METAAAAWLNTTVAEKSGLDDFDAVMRDHWPKVFRFALASLRDRSAAESLAQDCFLKAYQARESFRGESAVGTWLMQIAVNLMRDHSRNQRLRFWKRTQIMAIEPAFAVDSVSDGRSSPESSALAKQRLEAVWRAMDCLPEQQRTVFLLRFIEDMDLLEIAAATGLKEGTVKTHLFRALQAVRRKVGGIL